MACINSDGSLTPTARAVLQSLQQPGNIQHIARLTHIPLYRIRMSIRELSEAGFLVETVEGFRASESGLAQLEE